MSKRKVKVEMSDDQDNKITITFEGKLDEKSLKTLILSANNILGKEVATLGDSPDVSVEEALDMSLIERVKLLISTAHGMGSWFTTNDLCDSYHDVFSAILKITTASTYLARLSDEGFLERSGSRNERKFQIVREYREKLPKIITQ
ncbi:MAG TPA: hypothetical protein VMZ29_06260 [Candidatus Bathyarchaeia archaeon]|nr:hypothetical protein [Candidatus Bathyarchaeia archaeon]